MQLKLRGRLGIAAAAFTFAGSVGGTALATTPGADATADGEPVVIALLSDETGPSTAPAADVTRAAVDTLNAAGGLNGHPIDLQTWDAKGDPAAAQAAVSEFPSDVIAVLLSTPSTEATIADSLSALGVPVLGVGYNPSVWGGSVTPFQVSCASDPTFCARPNFLTTSTTFDAVIAEQLVAADAAGATKVTAVVCAEVDTCSSAIPIFEAIATGLGLEVSPTVKVSSTATDYSAECIGAIQDGVDFIQVGAASAVLSNLVTSCLDQGYTGMFGASAGSVNATALSLPVVVAGGLNGFPWFVDDPAVDQYNAAMQAAGVDEALVGSPVSTGTYSNILLLQKAIADYADPAAALDGAAALAAMYQVTDEDLGGLLASPVTFSEGNLDRNRPCFWPFIKDAASNIDNPLGGLTATCFPDASAAPPTT